MMRMKHQGMLLLLGKPGHVDLATKHLSITSPGDPGLFFATEKDLFPMTQALIAFVERDRKPAPFHASFSKTRQGSLLWPSSSLVEAREWEVFNFCAVPCHQDSENKNNLPLDYFPIHKYHASFLLWRKGQIREVGSKGWDAGETFLAQRWATF